MSHSPSASRKVYVTGSRPDLRVPMREIALSGGNPPLRLYDTSGPYTDPSADLDLKRGLTPLVRAITSNTAEVAKVLIEFGADVNQADARGNTPLHYAALSDYGETEIASLLLAAGAKRETKNNEGLNPAEVARKFKYTNLVALISGEK